MQSPPRYGNVGFCSEACSNAFWNDVMSCPLEGVGTDVGDFSRNMGRLYLAAVLEALNRDPKNREQAIARVKRALEINTDSYSALPMGDGGTLYKSSPRLLDFVRLGYHALALNLEKCGRRQDAADIYEKRLQMYDKARQLREILNQVIVKRTDISVNLNALLQQLREGGVAVVYRCPHCGGKLKINKDTSSDCLSVCQHCGAEIQTMDLADFLKTALS